MRPHGMTMFEIMLVIGLLAVVGLVTAQLFRGTMAVHRDTVSAHDAMSRTQRLNDQLRRDAWRAAAIESVDAGLRLIDADGSVIVWRVDEQTTLVRESTDEQHRWRLEMPVTLEGEGPSIHLRLGAPESGRLANLRFVSQVMLAKEGR